MDCVGGAVRCGDLGVRVYTARPSNLKGSCETGYGLIYVWGVRLLFVPLFSPRDLRGFFLFRWLNEDAPEYIPPRISFLVSRTPIAWGFPPFATDELDWLTVPILGKVEGDSSWKFERQFRIELEKSITEICCNEILMSRGSA